MRRRIAAKSLFSREARDIFIPAVAELASAQNECLFSKDMHTIQYIKYSTLLISPDLLSPGLSYFIII